MLNKAKCAANRLMFVLKLANESARPGILYRSVELTGSEEKKICLCRVFFGRFRALFRPFRAKFTPRFARKVFFFGKTRSSFACFLVPRAPNFKKLLMKICFF